MYFAVERSVATMLHSDALLVISKQPCTKKPASNCLRALELFVELPVLKITAFEIWRSMFCYHE
jgi:hypothetical protein